MAIQKGDKVLFEATVVDPRDKGNVVLQVGDRYFTASVDAIEQARYLGATAAPPKARPKGKRK